MSGSADRVLECVPKVSQPLALEKAATDARKLTRADAMH